MSFKRCCVSAGEASRRKVYAHYGVSLVFNHRAPLCCDLPPFACSRERSLACCQANAGASGHHSRCGMCIPARCTGVLYWLRQHVQFKDAVTMLHGSCCWWPEMHCCASGGSSACLRLCGRTEARAACTVCAAAVSLVGAESVCVLLIVPHSHA